MRKLLALLALSLPASFGQTPGNLAFTQTSHSATIVWFTIAGSYTNVRLRYIPSASGSCLTGSGGTVVQAFLNADVPGAVGPYWHQIVGGLQANTEYQVCVEATNNGGSSWTTGFGGYVTTLPTPPVHPAVPDLPATFDTSYPDTTGYQPDALNSTCSNWESVMSAAVTRQLVQGTVITVPANAVCEGQFLFHWNPPDVKEFLPAAVNTGTNTIAITSHGFTEGHGIIFSHKFACLPGSDNSGNCNGGPGYVYLDASVVGPIVYGHLYYACNVTANTFQVCNAPIASGGSVIPLPTTGGTGGGIARQMVAPYPRNLQWIIIRTVTADNQFVPEHVRVTPQWASKMPIFRPPQNHLGSRNFQIQNLTMGFSNDGSDGATMAAKIRLVGLTFGVPVNSNAGVSTNPPPITGWLITEPQHNSIIIDRCYFHSPGTPARVWNALKLDGHDIAIVDSYLDGMTYWRAWNSGFAPNTIN